PIRAADHASLHPRSELPTREPDLDLPVLVPVPVPVPVSVLVPVLVPVLMSARPSDAMSVPVRTLAAQRTPRVARPDAVARERRCPTAPAASRNPIRAVYRRRSPDETPTCAIRSFR